MAALKEKPQYSLNVAVLYNDNGIDAMFKLQELINYLSLSISLSPLLFGPQLIMFGLNNQLVVAYKEENMMALKHLFVRDYSGVDEDDYSTAVYTQQDFYQSLSFVLDQVRTHFAILCSSWPCGYFFSVNTLWLRSVALEIVFFT